ncbi:MAG: DUF6491 family protein [Woeseiaceae bacterium]|nr:DUF6491 family protein [Woeseiaceae bacterium]
MIARTLLIVALGSLGASTAFAEDTGAAIDGENAECFQTKRVHTIKRLDDKHVIAELLGGKRYVLGVEERCRRLDKAVQFTITSRGTRVCPASFAELYFTQRSGGANDCRIETVELLSDDVDDAEAAPAAEDDSSA